MKDKYDDNIRVGRGKNRIDYLSISFRIADELSPAVVTLCRYSVPGRYDTYNFDFAPSNQSGVGDRIRYFTDVGIPITKAIKMLTADLNKPHVVKMLCDSIEDRRSVYTSRLVALLESFGATRAYRSIKSKAIRRS